MTRNREITAHFRQTPVSRISLDRNTFLVPDNQAAHFFDIRATVHPFDAFDPRIVWSSSDSTITVPVVSEEDPMLARVNIPVLGERTGVAYINLAAIDGSKSASCMVVSVSTIIDDEPLADTLSIENHPYLVLGDINLSGRPRLTIEEGVLLFFTGEGRVNVEGELIVNNVTFSGNSQEERTRWQGLRFGDNSRNSSIHGSTIVNALRPLVIEGDSLNIVNVTIDGGDYNYEDYAVTVSENSSLLIDSLYIDGYGKGIVIYGTETQEIPTVSLTNTRVRYSSESVRPESIGLDIRRAVNIDFYNVEVEDY